MELMFGLLTASSFDQSIAIRRANLLPLAGLYEVARQADCNQLQCGPWLRDQLESGHGCTVVTAPFLVPKQQRFHSSAERGKLCVGHADHYRLRHWVSWKLLQRRLFPTQCGNRGSDLQGLQRHSCVLGIQPDHGAAMRSNLAADIFGDQQAL